MRVLIETHAPDGTSERYDMTDRAPVDVVAVLRDNPGIEHVTVLHADNLPDGIFNIEPVFELSRSQVKPEYL